ncbi:peptidyl-prolyl cis-trans isomerase PASTICCINO1-like [Curcuma longa]|uniref:peptidyl-prolyl cis-trans isomerase PASTICCINO1-like n=1 Tax=Curcuma longa TaxID=136217 RepID=UPI003D9DD7DB
MAGIGENRARSRRRNPHRRVSSRSRNPPNRPVLNSSRTKVLDASLAHVKALYRRGMAYMLLGDFVEAKKDFEMMMKVDKTAEPDATAALLKLKQKEQETERKARKQFKGLFDKKPGEISEVGSDVKDGSTPDDSKPETQNTMLEKEPGDKDHIDGNAAESIYEPDRAGLLGRLWPSGRRIFAALGLMAIL